MTLKGNKICYPYPWPSHKFCAKKTPPRKTERAGNLAGSPLFAQYFSQGPQGFLIVIFQMVLCQRDIPGGISLQDHPVLRNGVFPGAFLVAVIVFYQYRP